MPTGVYFFNYVPFGIPVSILVLLDDAYRPYITTRRSQSEVFVSILVLLDDAYRLNATATADISSLGFQSLFFWMMPTGLI